MGLFKLTAFASVGTGKSALFVTEHFTFQQCVRQGGAIYFDKWFTDPIGFMIQALNNQFLANAGFTINDGIQARIGNLINERSYSLNILTNTD